MCAVDLQSSDGRAVEAWSGPTATRQEEPRGLGDGNADRAHRRARTV